MTKESQSTQFVPIHKKDKPKKAWWRSKTVWFNAIATVGGLLAGTISKALEVAPEVIPVVQPMLDVGTLGKVMAAVTIGNILLRKKTHEPIGIKDTRHLVKLPSPSDYHHYILANRPEKDKDDIQEEIEDD